MIFLLILTGNALVSFLSQIWLGRARNRLQFTHCSGHVWGVLPPRQLLWMLFGQMSQLDMQRLNTLPLLQCQLCPQRFNFILSLEHLLTCQFSTMPTWIENWRVPNTSNLNWEVVCCSTCVQLELRSDVFHPCIQPWHLLFKSYNDRWFEFGFGHGQWGVQLEESIVWRLFAVFALDEEVRGAKT